MGPFEPRYSLRHLCLFGLFTLALTTPVRAQDPPPAPEVDAPAHIRFVDGVVILERDGQNDESPANMPLLAGDRVRTRTGRVEILFADGSTLHLDHNSTIDLQSDELIRMVDGRIRLTIPGPQREVSYRIDGPHGWAVIEEPGDYRLALLNGPRGSELELAVLRGRAQLANDDGQTALRAGERAFARAGAAPSYAYVVNSAAWDAFDRWSEARRDERMATSAQYLPDEVRPYAASFERYGYWRDEPTYGRVWYPRVDYDWRPYYRGRWVRLRPYGWTWVPYDPWGWPTHHYGRWGFSTAGWFWIPGRSWGAAWVSWAYAGDYVSWCPLGWNNRPVFQININIGRHYDPWRAWTVVHRRHFGYGYVHRYVVRVDHLDVRTRTSFAHRDRAPDFGGYAVPRGDRPIRVAGTAAGRRPSGSPVYTNLPADRARISSDAPRVQISEPRGARPRADAVRGDTNARTGPQDRAERAVPRARTVPDRPVVRSDRPADPGYSRAPGDAAVPRSDAPDAAGRRAVPRGGDEPRPGWGSTGSRAIPRAEPRQNAPTNAPSPSEPRRYGRPVEAQPPSAPHRPSYEPRSRAVPRGDYGRPSPDSARPGGDRPSPQAERRGPERASPGSYERRPPAASGPSRDSHPSGEGRAPAAGARPRSGGGSGGTAVRRPGGGRG